jgi:transcriptional regulator of acetoin/glycerol metabolism
MIQTACRRLLRHLWPPPDSTLTNALTVLAGVADPDAVRRDRGLAEYRRSASSDIDSDHVCWAADVAQAIINAVANDLAHRADT